MPLPYFWGTSVSLGSEPSACSWGVTRGAGGRGGPGPDHGPSPSIPVPSLSFPFLCSPVLGDPDLQPLVHFLQKINLGLFPGAGGWGARLTPRPDQAPKLCADFQPPPCSQPLRQHCLFGPGGERGAWVPQGESGPLFLCPSRLRGLQTKHQESGLYLSPPPASSPPHPHLIPRVRH